MAEFAIKIGDGPRFSDGDILDVFPRRRIRCCHAQHICHVKHQGFNADGLRVRGTLAEDLPILTEERRLERVSRTEIMRTILATGESEVLGPKPNANGECIDVETFIDRRIHRQKMPVTGADYNALNDTTTVTLGGRGFWMDDLSRLPSLVDLPFYIRNLRIKVMYRFAGPTSFVSGVSTVTVFGRLNVSPGTLVGISKEFRIFGTEGSEVWYGGRIDFTHSTLDRVWQAIETKTPHREANHPHWPAGTDELRVYLFLPTVDFTDAEAESLVAEEWDRTDPEKPVLIRKRSHQVKYRELTAISSHLRNIDDPAVAVDLRGEVAALAKSAARQKPAAVRDEVVRDVEAK